MKKIKKQKPIASKIQARKPADTGNRDYKIPLIVIVLISFMVFLPIFKNEFVNFDDGKYIQENPMLSSIQLGKLFSTYTEGNYHPITMLTYAIGYQFFGQQAAGYHALSLLLHLLNVILVFYVILSLSGRKEVALVASLLFGIHPLHVESVAWASELKDLLYTFFFLSSWICYLKFSKTQNRKFYFFCLFLFLISLFSKAMAVSLPIVLLLTDYFTGRKLTAKIWLEKIPFFILSILFGIIAVIAQKSGGAIEDVNVFPLLQRVAFASYSFITYLVKLLFPFHLSAFYPYPVQEGASIPGWYYVYPVVLLALFIFVFYTLRNTRKIFFGLSFFLITIFLVLQLLPVGSAIMADRYTYIPSIGIFYLAGEGFYRLWQKKESGAGWKFASLSLLFIATIFFSVKTYERCPVWENGMTLWNDVISKEKNTPQAYTNRGSLLQKENKFSEALDDYGKAIALQPNFAITYYNRGILFANLNKFNEALQDYNKAIELKPDYAIAYNNRSVLYREAGKNNEALADCNKAIALQPGYSDAYSNRGILFAMANKYPEAHQDFDKAIELNPNHAKAFCNRGLLFMKEKKNDQSLANYNRAIELEPGYPDVYYNRGILYRDINKQDEALQDFSKVIELQPGYTMAYYNRSLIFLDLKKYNEAISDCNKMIQFQSNMHLAYYNRALAEYNTGNKETACEDLQKSSGSGYQPASDLYKQWCH